MTVELWFSAIALVLSATSMGIHVWTWSRSGPVVKVKATQGWLTYSGGGVSDNHVVLTAHNAGRLPVTVTSVGIELPNKEKGSMFSIRTGHGDSPLPHKLDNGAEGHWFIPTSEVLALCEKHDVRYQKVRGFVTLAGGRRVYAKRRGIGLK